MLPVGMLPGQKSFWLARLKASGIGALVVRALDSVHEEYYACLVDPAADIAGCPFFAHDRSRRGIQPLEFDSGMEQRAAMFLFSKFPGSNSSGRGH